MNDIWYTIKTVQLKGGENMADTRLLIRCSEEVAELFRKLAEEEGRKQGKLLEILLHEYENCVCKNQFND